MRRLLASTDRPAPRAQRTPSPRAEDHVRRHVPLDLIAGRSSRPTGLRVAVVGAGFAGMAAADALHNLGAEVSVFEAGRVVGGRVRSTSFVPTRVLEEGAELIGSSHTAWIRYAQQLGLGLSGISDGDAYAQQMLAPQLRLAHRTVSPDVLRGLNQGAKAAEADLVRRAAAVTDPYTPWTATGAAETDATSVDAWIRGFLPGLPRRRAASPELVGALLQLEYANHMATPTTRQSLLAVIAQVAGGGRERHWDDVEVFRCEDGNAALATSLAQRITTTGPRATLHLQREVTHLDLDGAEVVVRSQATLGSGVYRQLQTRHDYAVVAVPPTTWQLLRLNDAPFLPRLAVNCGPAVKYLARVDKRYWVQRGMAPGALDDELGQVWEGTDNQMGGTAIDLTVFAGGPLADAMRAHRPPDRYTDPRLNRLLPGFTGPGGRTPHRSLLVDWPAMPYIRTGYSCPAPGEVIKKVRPMQQPIDDRIFLAGEHVSPAFFGFMEGALQTGLIAAKNIALAAGLPVPGWPPSA